MLVGAATLPKQLEGAVGDYLVGGENLITGEGDRLCLLVVKNAELAVCQRCRLLHIGQLIDEMRELRQADARKRKILHCTQRLDAVVGAIWDLAPAEKIVLAASDAGYRSAGTPLEMRARRPQALIHPLRGARHHTIEDFRLLFANPFRGLT